MNCNPRKNDSFCIQPSMYSPPQRVLHITSVIYCISHFMASALILPAGPLEQISLHKDCEMCSLGSFPKHKSPTQRGCEMKFRFTFIFKEQLRSEFPALGWKAVWTLCPAFTGQRTITALQFNFLLHTKFF